MVAHAPVAGVSIHNKVSFGGGYDPKGVVGNGLLDNLVKKWQGGPTEGEAYPTQVIGAPNCVEHFYDTGTKIIKKRKAPRVPMYDQGEAKRAPDAPMRSIRGNLAPTGVPHGAYEFKLEETLAEAIKQASHDYDIEHTAKNFPEPLLYREFERTGEPAEAYMRELHDYGLKRTATHLKGLGYTDEQIKEFFNKQAERNIAKDAAGASLPTTPHVNVGAVPAPPRNLSAFELATDAPVVAAKRGYSFVRGVSLREPERGRKFVSPRRALEILAERHRDKEAAAEERTHERTKKISEELGVKVHGRR